MGSPIEERIRKHRAFWEEPGSLSAPLVAFTVGAGADSWSYWQYNQAAVALTRKPGPIEPDDLRPESFVADQRRYLRACEEIGDDAVRTALPLASIPWMEAVLGCPVVCSGQHFAAEPALQEVGEWCRLGFDPDNPWVDKYVEFIEVYQSELGGEHPVAQTVLRGPSDLACAVLGAEKASLAMLQAPEDFAALLGRAGEILADFIRFQTPLIPLFHEGQVIGQYEIWTPGTAVRLQEDFAMLYSPERYERFLMPIDEQLCRLADYSLFHTHTTCLFLLPRIARLPGLGVLQVTKDEGSAGVDEILSALQPLDPADLRMVLKGRFSEDELMKIRRFRGGWGLIIQPVVDSVEEARRILPLLG